MASLKKALRLLSRQGPAALLREIRRKLYFSHISHWFVLPLDDTVREVRPRFDARLDFGHPREVADWIRKLGVPGTNDETEIGSMLERGQHFVGIMDGDRRVGFIKIGWEKTYILDYGCDVDFPPGSCFIIDSYVIPDMRGRGGGPYLFSASAVEMKKRGFTTFILHVREDNVPSLKSVVKAGYRQVGTVRFRSFLGSKKFDPHPSTFFSG